MTSWFETDRQGLRKLIRKRGIETGVIELLQNALDEETSLCVISLTKLPNRRQRYELTVTDNNPEGFKDLSHAYTLFAESAKKDNPEQRGRWNLGEKLVIALCERAEISSTKGTVIFDERGRTHARQKRDAGSRFAGEIIMDEQEFRRVEQKVKSLLPPKGVEVIFNEVVIPYRDPLRSFTITLPTLRTDEEGNLTPTRRATIVDIHRPRVGLIGGGEQAMIYEMGLPVVETEDRFHVDVHQKVPLNMNRDNVTPAYLRELRTAVLNNTYDLLDADAATGTWVKEALEDDAVEKDAVTSTLDKLYTRKRVSFDPSDPEANKRAAAEGYTVIPGRALSHRAWDNAKRFEAVRPAGQVTPSPTPYGTTGEVRKELPEEQWTPEIRNVVGFTKALAKRLMDVGLEIYLINDAKAMNFGATYGRVTSRSATMEFNYRRLGRDWFDLRGNFERVLGLIIHEFAHQVESDHLSESYYKALTKLGAQTTELALAKPEFFKPFLAATSKIE